MTPNSFRLLVVTTLVAALTFALAGCSRESRKVSRLERAKSALAAGDWAHAEIDLLAVLRLDPQDAVALGRLGQIYFDQGRAQRAAPYLVLARNVAPEDTESRRRLAVLLLQDGRRDEARAEAVFIVEHQPRDGEALLLLAEASATAPEIADARERLGTPSADQAFEAQRLTALALLQLRERELPAAEELVRQALVADENSPQALGTLATLLAAQGDLAGAVAAYQRAGAVAPLRSPQRIIAARFLVRANRIDAARPLLDAAVEGAPDYLPAAIWRAELALVEHDFAACRRLLDHALKLEPSFVDTLSLQARLQLAQGDFEAAEAGLSKLVEANPRSPELLYTLARAQLAGPKSAAALPTLQQALAVNPDYLEAALLLAELNIRRGDPAAAVTAMHELTRRRPGVLEAWRLLARAYHQRGNLPMALQTLTESNQRFPDQPEIFVLTGGVLRQMKRDEEAAAAFNRALAVDPGFAPAVEQLVALDLGAGRIAAAAERVQGFVAAHPDQPAGHLLAAHVALAQKDTASAEAALRRAIALRPDNPAAYLQLARIFIEAGRADDAVRELEAAVTKDPGDVALQMVLGTLLQQRGDIDRARTAYEQAVKYQPRFVAALNNLAYIYSENDHDYDRAYETADRARKLAPFDPFVQDTFGWILYHRGQYAWAKGLLLESAAKLDDAPTIKLHLGLTHYQLAEEPEATRLLRAYLDSGATGAEAAEAQSCLAVLASDPKAAPDATRTLAAARLAQHPGEPVAMLRLAVVAEEAGDLARAQTLHTELLAAHPRHPRVLIAAARFKQRRGDGARALELARTAIDLAPNDAEVIRATGRLAYLAGDFVRAANLSRDAARRQPEVGAVQAELADALFAIGELAPAEAAARAALTAGLPAAEAAAVARDVALLAFVSTPATDAVPAAIPAAVAAAPESPAALLATLELGRRTGDLETAATAGEKLVARFPECHAAALRLAAVHLARGAAPERTLALAQKVRLQLPNDPEAARILGVLAYQKDDFARAATLLAESTGKGRTDARSWFLLGAAQHRLNQPGESQRALQRALAGGLTGAEADEARRLLAAAGRGS